MKADQSCDLSKIERLMKTKFNNKDPSTKNVGNHNKNHGHKHNFKTLIDNYSNKIQRLVDNTAHPCCKCHAQYVDTNIKLFDATKNTYICSKCKLKGS